MDGEARLLAMQARPDGLGLLLDAGGTHLTVDVGLSERSAHALHHLHVLHGGGHPCAAAAQRQAPVVDALLRAVRAVGGTPRALVVRGGAEPAFWLRVDGPDGSRDVDLDVLDAAALLLSHRLPLRLAAGTVTDWDAALRSLVDEGG